MTDEEIKDFIRRLTARSVSLSELAELSIKDLVYINIQLLERKDAWEAANAEADKSRKL